MSRRLGFAAALLLLTVGALALRVPSLGNRPMHGDEAVHAFKFRDLWERGTYRYDPNEYHGPTLYYATLPSVWARRPASFAETRPADYRVVTAVCGALMLLLLALLVDGLGRRPALAAAALLALSPALVFYSRYYIQETLLAFFTLAMLATGWRFVRDRRVGWLAACGACGGLMLATKETAFLAFAGAGLAWLGLRLVARRRPVPTAAEGRDDRTRTLRLPARLAVFGAAFAVAAFLPLSGGGRYPAGALDVFRALTPWLQRAGGTDLHNHPWSYYLGMLAWTHVARGPVWTEGVILVLAVVGLVVAFFAPRRLPPGVDPALARFVGLFTVLLTLLYSAIPYKTPWCVLSPLLGMALLGGVGAVALLRAARGRALRGLAALLLLAGGAQLGWLAYLTSYPFAGDGRNPYVYAQPVPDVEALGQRVVDLAMASPDRDRTVVKVISVDGYYWPLPWYLRRLQNVGYWTSMPTDPVAPVVLSSPEYDEDLTRRLDATHLMTGYYGLRPATVMQVWVSMDVWKAYLATHKPPPQ